MIGVTTPALGYCNIIISAQFDYLATLSLWIIDITQSHWKITHNSNALPTDESTLYNCTQDNHDTVIITNPGKGTHWLDCLYNTVSPKKSLAWTGTAGLNSDSYIVRTRMPLRGRRSLTFYWKSYKKLPVTGAKRDWWLFWSPWYIRPQDSVSDSLRRVLSAPSFVTEPPIDIKKGPEIYGLVTPGSYSHLYQWQQSNNSNHQWDNFAVLGLDIDWSDLNMMYAICAHARARTHRFPGKNGQIATDKKEWGYSVATWRMANQARVTFQPFNRFLESSNHVNFAALCGIDHSIYALQISELDMSKLELFW